MPKICSECGKERKITKNGFCAECLKKLSPEAQKETRIGKPKDWNCQRDQLWKSDRGNDICERCYMEVSRSVLIEIPELGYSICKECEQKRKKIRKSADAYWKDKQATTK